MRIYQALADEKVVKGRRLRMTCGGGYQWVIDEEYRALR